MKVLLLTTASGTNAHSKRLRDLLIANGCEVVLMDNENPHPDGRAHFAYEPFPRAGAGLLQKVFGPSLGASLTLRSMALQWSRVFRRVRPDIVHVVWVDERAAVCALAGMRPLVLTVLGSDVNDQFTPESLPLRKKAVSLALARADRVIIDSADMVEKCRVLAGREVPTSLLTMGVDTNLFRPGYSEQVAALRAELEIPDGAGVLLSVRGLRPIYGQESILRAFAAASPSFTRDAVLVVRMLYRESEGGRQLEVALRAEAARLGIERSIRWVDPVPFSEIPVSYAMADAVVNFPCRDAFPVTFLEASACERMVLSSRLPAYEGTFAERFFPMLDPEDITGLAGLMACVVNGTPHPELDAGMARLPEARSLMEAEYSEAETGRRLLSLYSELASRRT